MNDFKWTEELNVGSDELNAEHKKLIKYMADFKDAMLNDKTQEGLSEIFDKLIEYTQTHFVNEEEALAKTNYPYLEEHKATHKALVAKVLALKNDFGNGSLAMGSKTLLFLNDWIVGHIKNVDKLYKAYLQ